MALPQSCDLFATHRERIFSNDGRCWPTFGRGSGQTSRLVDRALATSGHLSRLQINLVEHRSSPCDGSPVCNRCLGGGHDHVRTRHCGMRYVRAFAVFQRRKNRNLATRIAAPNNGTSAAGAIKCQTNIHNHLAMILRWERLCAPFTWAVS